MCVGAGEGEGEEDEEKGERKGEEEEGEGSVFAALGVKKPKSLLHFRGGLASAVCIFIYLCVSLICCILTCSLKPKPKQNKGNTTFL